MNNSTNYYIGTISKISENKESRIVEVAIPGVATDITAYPKSTELDEAKIGDPVLVLDLDPIFHSYFIYEKLKENNFIGFRASGKMVSISPDNIKIAVFKEGTRYLDSKEPSEDSIKAQVVIDKDGNISIESSGEIGIYGKSNSEPATVIFGNKFQPGEVDISEEVPDKIGGPFVTSVVEGCPFYARKLKNIGGKM